MDERGIAEREGSTEVDPFMPPSDPLAEMAVIGSAMMSRRAIDDCVGIVTGADFYRPANERVWDAVLSVYASGQPVDAITVADELTQSGSMRAISSGAAYLHQAVSSVATPANAAYYAQIVADKAVLRRLEDAAARLRQMVYNGGEGGVESVVAAAQAEVANVLRSTVQDVSNADSLDSALASLDRPVGIPTPWPKLNAAIVGWAKKALYVVGARPAVGKTAFAMEIAMHAASAGHRTLVFSMEMPRDELYLRMLSNAAQVHNSKIQHRNLTKYDIAELEDAAYAIKKWPILVDDRAGLTLDQIRMRIRREQSKGPVELVIIDYLQLIRPGRGFKGDRRIHIDETAQGGKEAAKELDVPIITLAQLNRASEARTDKTPTMADLREAGGIEQAADVVALLHREDVSPKVMGVGIPKNRQGATGNINLHFEGEYSRITTPSWEETQTINESRVN